MLILVDFNGLRSRVMNRLSYDLSFFFNLFIYDSYRERKREAETQAEGEAGSMHREPDVGFDPGSPGSRPGPKAGAKPLRHPGIPLTSFKYIESYSENSSLGWSNQGTCNIKLSLESSVLIFHEKFSNARRKKCK